MRVRVLVVALAVIGALAARPASAEPVGRHLEVTPMGGFMIFDPDTVRGIGVGLRDAVYMGARLGWQFEPWMGFEVAVGASPTSEDKAGPTADHGFLHASGNLFLTPWARRAGGPFLSVGAGASRFTHVGPTNLNQGNVEFAAGARLWLADAVGLRLEVRDIRWIPNDVKLNNPTDHLMIGAGIVVALGAVPRDTDGDGVTDKRDRCPGTPRGARVDVNGCPLDSDGDKVFDGLDRCEKTPKGCTVDASGCPGDADGDGVCDGADQCADTPKGATVDASGCPKDSDGDGVLDGIDQCASTRKGCTPDAQGCPRDSDEDGVCDGLDYCPDTSPGLKVDKDGCPIELVERETELLDTGMIRLQNINFETNKTTILPESYPTLDIVGQVLAKWPELRIEVGGHADARGSDVHNQRLSEGRAGSVLAYLTSKFPTLKADQFSVKGYGESVPLVPNTSALNWAKNRRVEFVVLNKDVLKREVERRRLLRSGEPAPRDQSKPVQPDAKPDSTRK